MAVLSAITREIGKKMNTRIIVMICLPPLILLMGIFLSCSGSSQAIAPVPTDNSSESTAVISSDNNSLSLPDEEIPSEEPLRPPDRIDLTYFYIPQRCPNCFYIEKHITFVVKTYFQDKVDSGRLVYKALNLGDKENTAIAKKYMAINSQLCINTIVDGVDHIRTIKEVWFPEYLKDEKALDEVIKSYIERGFNGELNY